MIFDTDVTTYILLTIICVVIGSKVIHGGSGSIATK